MSAVQDIISSAEQLMASRPSSATIDRALAMLIKELASVIDRLEWVGAHRYAKDLNIDDRRATLLQHASVATELFGEALLHLSAHTESTYLTHVMSAQLVNLSKQLDAEGERLANLESTLSFRLSDPDLALIQLEKRRDALRREPKHSREALLQLSTAVGALHEEVRSSERLVNERRTERDKLKLRYDDIVREVGSIRVEVVDMSERLEILNVEKDRLEVRSIALGQELAVVEERARELRATLEQLSGDPRSEVRSAVARALKCLPKDETER